MAPSATSIFFTLTDPQLGGTPAGRLLAADQSLIASDKVVIPAKEGCNDQPLLLSVERWEKGVPVDFQLLEYARDEGQTAASIALENDATLAEDDDG